MNDERPRRAAAREPSHTRARDRALASAAAVACGVLGASAACVANSADTDPHAHHHEMMNTPPTVTRSTISYTVPDVSLVRADGAHVKLAQELDDGRPVLLDFIFTTCTTICPVMSQTFAEVERQLGAQAAKVKMVSVSIDPEEDTPQRLTEYAKRYRAGAQWTFYTGTTRDSIAVQRAFDVYRGDKMYHSPATLLRPAPGQPWVRLDGFVTPDDLLTELRPVLANKAP